MGYRIDIDHGGCINCGICMDVCPVEALDMSRPQQPGIETGQGFAAPLAWTMEHPIQVGECIGCGICIGQCPVSVMTLATQVGLTDLAPRQGPIHRPEPETHGWAPLSAVTLESLKPAHPSSWSDINVPVGQPFGWPTERTAGRDASAGATRPPAPCQAACPAGTDAGRYVGLVAQGRYDDAYAVAAEVNPFPSVCGWICTAPCESVCRRGELDEPISIRTIKRFAAEHGTLPPVAAPTTKRSGRVAIVGGGPAGMSAAWYLARLGYGVTVLEAMPIPGGMMAIGIPAYRLPREVLQAEIARITGLGVELRLNAVMGRDFTLDDLEREGFQAVFLATGASKSRHLGVPGDDLDGVVPATLFLKRVNLGEAPTLSGDVVVVGGGSTAMDAARSALRSGAASVTIAYRRTRADMPAQVEEIEAAEREGVVIRTELTIGEVVGRDGFAMALRCRPTTAVADHASAEGDPDLDPSGGREIDLAARTILVAIGEEPDPSILPEGSGIEVSAWAGVVADNRTMATGRAGIFAGGDVVSGPKTIIDAVAAGRRAAGSIHEYLAGVRDGEGEILRAVRYATAPERDLVLDLERRPRLHPALPMLDLASFAPNQPGFDQATARAEAGRCFRCDAVEAATTVHVVAGRGPDDRPGIAPARPPLTPNQLDQPTATGGAA
jgi:NADPH-dependent glutamate synthase beta subunit-like oxidoreductase/NAD-dependent dihydropyrimidine dehydrogenase PreA subunit